MNLKFVFLFFSLSLSLSLFLPFLPLLLYHLLPSISLLSFSTLEHIHFINNLIYIHLQKWDYSIKSNQAWKYGRLKNTQNVDLSTHPTLNKKTENFIVKIIKMVSTFINKQNPIVQPMVSLLLSVERQHC
ncbi:hypothetical protein BD560DRAFT_381874 [Blakeslea trispora]|nr:hypothetical protein BD560DRAFT_381874 [Blakeslea trispora]